MNANEELAELYKADIRQFVGIDGEFWKHDPKTQLCLGNWIWVVNFKQLDEDREDYEEFLKEYNVTEKFVRQISENETDLISTVDWGIQFKISNSPIEGKGVISLIDLYKGYYIGKTRINNNRTPLGRYLNHSKNANAEMTFFDGAIGLFAVKHISVNEEITVDYRQVAKDIQGLTPCPS